MQKKLIALAVAGMISAPAFAQSNVTVYGRMDIGVMSKDDAAGNSVLRVDDSQWTTSRLGFKGSEDLGNGLKAVFQIESRLRNEGDSNLNTNRDTFVGLSGGFGTLIAGRNSTPLNAWLMDFDANGSNAFRHTNVGLAGALETRVSNSVVYVAPAMGGLSAAVLYAPDEVDGVKSDVYGLGVRYNGGPLSAFYTYHVVDNLVDNHALGASYDFGGFKLLGSYIYNDFDVSGAEEETALNLGVQVKVGGAGTVGLGYGMERDIAGVSDADQDIISLTYKHELSKRTFMYAGYQRVDPDGGEERDTFGVGVAHMF